MNEQTEKDALVMEAMMLAYAVDRQTDYAVFIDYSGHVESLYIRIVESKDRYQNEIASTRFYVTGKYEHTDNMGWLKAKRDHLKDILDTGDVDISLMQEVVHQTVEYAF